MTTRKMACISAHEPDADLCAILEGSGWQVEHLDVGENSGSVPAPSDCTVGIFIVTASDREWLARLQLALAQLQGLAWVAVVDRALVADERVRELIAVHCIDYQTTPLARERVLYALGHAAGMAALAREIRGDSRARANLNVKAAREKAERLAILAALHQSGGSASKSAPMVGVSRATFYRLLEKHGFGSCDIAELRRLVVS